MLVFISPSHLQESHSEPFLRCGANEKRREAQAKGSNSLDSKTLLQGFAWESRTFHRRNTYANRRTLHSIPC
jgi:hypothetical protein